MYSVPVRCEPHGVIGELQGVLRLDGATLSLQYQVADRIMHEFRSAPVDLAFAPASLVEAKMFGGFLGLSPSLELRVAEIQALAALPAQEPGRLRLRVRFSDRRDAQRIVEGINSICAEQRLAQLDASLDALQAPLRAPRSGP